MCDIEVGNTDIYAEQKIWFKNETKWNEIWSRVEFWAQKIFQTLLANFIKVMTTKIAENFIHFARHWQKWAIEDSYELVHT